MSTVYIQKGGKMVSESHSPSKIPLPSFYTFLSDEELLSIQEHLQYELKKRAVNAIVHQKHMLEEELLKQETMQERAVVRKELREVCKQIKKLQEDHWPR